MKKIILIFLSFLLISCWNINLKEKEDNLDVTNWKCSLFNLIWWEKYYSGYDKKWLEYVKKLWFCKQDEEVVNIFTKDENFNYIWILFFRDEKPFINIYNNDKLIYSKETTSSIVYGEISDDIKSYYFKIRWPSVLDVTEDMWLYINWKKILDYNHNYAIYYMSKEDIFEYEKSWIFNNYKLFINVDLDEGLKLIKSLKIKNLILWFKDDYKIEKEKIKEIFNYSEYIEKITIEDYWIFKRQDWEIVFEEF